MILFGKCLFHKWLHSEELRTIVIPRRILQLKPFLAEEGPIQKNFKIRKCKVCNTKEMYGIRGYNEWVKVELNTKEKREIKLNKLIK